MKRSIIITLLLLCATSLFAQAPEKFSYQAVVRNASNSLVTNAPVGVRVSILQGRVLPATPCMWRRIPRLLTPTAC